MCDSWVLVLWLSNSQMPKVIKMIFCITTALSCCISQVRFQTLVCMYYCTAHYHGLIFAFWVTSHKNGLNIKMIMSAVPLHKSAVWLVFDTLNTQYHTNILLEFHFLKAIHYSMFTFSWTGYELHLWLYLKWHCVFGSCRGPVCAGKGDRFQKHQNFCVCEVGGF